MMKGSIIILYFIGLFIFGSACISDIDFDVPGRVQNAVAIQAKIVKGTPNVVFVEVQNAVDFTGLSAAIRARDVFLTNISSGQRIEIPNNGSNSYELELPDGNPDLSINYDDEYSLQVTTFDGAVFESSPERLVPVPEPESISFEYVELVGEARLGITDITEALRFYINTPTRNQFNDLTSMRWQFEHTFKATDSPPNPNLMGKTCFITENLGAISEVNYNPSILGEEQLTRFELIDVTITSAHAEGNYFTAIQHSLSDEAFTYFNQINELLSRDGSIFDAPAGIIETNFTNISDVEQQVFGYFYMTELDTIRVFVDPELALNPARACPPPPTPGRPTTIEICFDCLDVDRSTITQPSWWIN